MSTIPVLVGPGTPICGNDREQQPEKYDRDQQRGPQKRPNGEREMFEAMKIIHMFAILGGGAATIGNGLLLRRVMASEGPPPEMVASTMRILGSIGLASIVLLWATGVVMNSLGGYSMDLQYAVKLIGAAMVLGAVALMARNAAQAAKAGGAPNFKTLKILGSVSRVGLFLAIVFAVTAFN